MSKQVNNDAGKSIRIGVSGMVSEKYCLEGTVINIGGADIFHPGVNVYKRENSKEPWIKVQDNEVFEIISHFQSFQSDYAFSSIEL